MDGIRGKMHSRSQRGAFCKSFSRVRNLPRADSSEGSNELPLQSPLSRPVGSAQGKPALVHLGPSLKSPGHLLAGERSSSGESIRGR